MPTTYAHFRFGCDVLERLPARQKAIIETHRTLFDFGVHGPDLLFYYKPLSKTASASLDTSVTAAPAETFLQMPF